MSALLPIDGIDGVHGHVAPGFERVADAFASTLGDRATEGAGFAAIRDGLTLVDIWGGVADHRDGRPWSADTIVGIFSGGKGIVATCMASLIERGRLDLDEPVARYWPEFGAHGKDTISIAQVLSHTAGVPGIRRRLTLDDILDGARMATLVAEEPPYAPPGTVLQYHRLTYGWICAELVRRVDGRTLGRYFAEELARPHGLDAWIGLSAEHESWAATVRLDPAWGSGASPFDAAHAAGDADMASVWANPPMYAPGSFPWNDRATHAAEIPGAGAIAAPRSMARLYALLVGTDERPGDGRVLSPQTVAVARTQLSHGPERWLGRPMRFGAGYALQGPRMQFGPPPDAFGHPGAGGSLHGAWPQERVGFSYAMNLMREGEESGSGRGAVVLTELHRSIMESGL